MSKKLTKSEEDLLQKLGEATEDLLRTRADFENYRKRVDAEKAAAFDHGRETMVAKLLPVIDDIERASSHLPADLRENKWAQGVATLAKNLDKMLESLGITKIIALQGTPFNPDQHHAVQFDDETDGAHEVVAEELQPGYMLDGKVLRPAMVRVMRANETR